MIVAAVAVWGMTLATAQSLGALGALRARRTPCLPTGSHDTALLLRPCAGLEPGLEANLLSASLAAWRGPVRVRLGVSRADDPAAELCERAAESLRRRGIDAERVITGADGPNPKAAQLAAMLAREGGFAGPVLVADSDVDLTGLPLGELAARLSASADLAAVWAPPVERGGDTLGDRASRAVLSGSLHAFSLLAHLDPAGVVGKLLAMRGDALAAAGGFDAVQHHLGEDLELARRWRAAGWRVECASFVAPSSASGRDLRAVIARYARWMTVIRAQRPRLVWSYPAMFFATVPWTLAALALGLAHPPAAPVLTLVALCVWLARAAVAAVARRCAGAAGSFRESLLADAVLAASFARAMRSRRFAWRGRALVLRDDGSLGAA
ncbi:MAG: glycosyltransferase [Polyangiales bacterium]